MGRAARERKEGVKGGDGERDDEGVTCAGMKKKGKKGAESCKKKNSQKWLINWSSKRPSCAARGHVTDTGGNKVVIRKENILNERSKWEQCLAKVAGATSMVDPGL